MAEPNIGTETQATTKVQTWQPRLFMRSPIIAASPEVSLGQAATHRPVDHEAETTEHLLLYDVGPVREDFAHARRERFVEAHGPIVLSRRAAEEAARSPPSNRRIAVAGSVRHPSRP